MDILNILLFSTPAEGQESGGLLSFLPLVLIMVVFYFFFIRPQMKKAKDQRVFREALKKGDKVITIGGIHGRIAEVKETTVLLDVEGGNKLLLEKSAIISDSAQVGLAK
jgi:preprotein translocase subunit YajC